MRIEGKTDVDQKNKEVKTEKIINLESPCIFKTHTCLQLSIYSVGWIKSRNCSINIFLIEEDTFQELLTFITPIFTPRK